MKIFSLIIILIMSIASNAQVSKVSLQASGLTCSMCSNAINKSLKALDFVDKVDADIKTYTFEISFKPNSNVDFNKIKTQVEKAGFSVSGFVATIYFNNIIVKNNQPVLIGDKTLLFVNVKDQSLNGAKQIKLIDKGFVSPKEGKRYNFNVPSSGTFHATI